MTTDDKKPETAEEWLSVWVAMVDEEMSLYSSPIHPEMEQTSLYVLAAVAAQAEERGRREGAEAERARIKREAQDEVKERLANAEALREFPLEVEEARARELAALFVREIFSALDDDRAQTTGGADA